MPFGARAYNGSGALTFSSDGMIFGYIGKATNTAIQQAGTSTIDAFAGYSTYTIDWPGKIIVALPLILNKPTALRSVSQSGVTWTITVHRGSSASDSLGFDVQEVAEVFVFGAPVSVSGWGLAIRNQAGDLTGDLSRRPLFFDRFVDFGDSVPSVTMTGLTKPAFIGAQPTWIRTTEMIDGSTWENREIIGGWMLEAGGVMSRANILWNRFEDDGPWVTFSNKNAVSVVVIEAADLT
jgi:hypothetical protein